VADARETRGIGVGHLFKIVDNAIEKGDELLGGREVGAFRGQKL
jgi:hypothetical protein